MSDSAAEDLSYDDQLEAAWDEHNKPEEEIEETEAPEAVEETTEEPEEATEEAEEPEEEPEADLLEPHQHWKEEDKALFRTLNRQQQEGYLDREKRFQRHYDSTASGFNQAKAAINEYQQMLSPLVQDWERQGLPPSQGLMRLVALEKDLRDNPAQALIRLAGERGVNLEQEYANQPYVDPQVRQVQEELRRVNEEMDKAKRYKEETLQQQQQASQDYAYQQLQTFANTKDDAGNQKYPYINDKTVMSVMGEAMETGQVTNLHDAYEAAMNHMRNHPFFKDQVSKQSDSVQAKVKKAKSASKVVRGETSAASITNQDADILQMLEDAGLE